MEKREVSVLQIKYKIKIFVVTNPTKFRKDVIYPQTKGISICEASSDASYCVIYSSLKESP